MADTATPAALETSLAAANAAAASARSYLATATATLASAKIGLETAVKDHASAKLALVKADAVSEVAKLAAHGVSLTMSAKTKLYVAVGAAVVGTALVAAAVIHFFL